MIRFFSPSAKSIQHIIIPGTGKELLRRELCRAFAAAGCRVSEVSPTVPHDASPEYLTRLAELLDGAPALLFSVNFQGLNPLKAALELLERAGGPAAVAAVWCVDNPWNLLAGVRDPRWKALPLFVTDPSFIAPLREHGAERVFHLPLAAAPELFAQDPARDARFPAPEGLAPFVFVGRPAFPGKELFFAGQSVPKERMDEAGDMLSAGQRPDLNWWERALDCTPGAFWPGKKARQPALGAEEANLLWRGLCLRSAAMAGKQSLGAVGEHGLSAVGALLPDAAGLDIFGGQEWLPYLPPLVSAGARLHPPVDYYARLPGIYAKARFNICLTSLQLPKGLNQRHFDIWMAGGLCLTDATPGLDLFPQELTRPITFTRAQNIAAVAEQADAQRAALIADWQSHLLAGHTYAHRVQTVLETIDSPGSWG